MSTARLPAIAAIVAALGAAGPAAAQQSVGAACGDVLATLPLLGSAMQAVTEESLRSQIARFTLPPGISGTDIFACLCGRDPDRDFFAVVEDMAAAGQEDLAACVDTASQEAQGTVVTVGPRPSAAGGLSDPPAVDGAGGADRWREYSDADLRALMQLDPALLTASLGATTADLRAELGRRLVARWQAAEAGASLSDADLRFVLEDVYAGAASAAIMEVLAQEIERRRGGRPMAVVRGRLEGGDEPTIAPADRASTHFDGWSDAALAGLMVLDAADVQVLAGHPRRSAAEELASRLLEPQSPTETPAAPIPVLDQDAADAAEPAPVEIVHGAPRQPAPPTLTAPRVVRTDVDDGVPQRDADTVQLLADCLDAFAPTELAPLLRQDPDRLIGICLGSP